MTEPAAPAADAPTWEEARGPHLPDRLTGVPLLAWPFLLLAIVQAAGIYLAQAGEIRRDPAGLLLPTILYATPKVVSCLLGAALFIRHRDAVRTIPMVAVGVSLFAAEQVLGMLYVPLQPVLESLPSAGDDGTFVMLASSAYSLFSSVVGVFALLYLARGLEGARRFEGGFGRRIGIALLIAALVTIGVAAVGYLRMPINDVVGGPILIGLSLLVSAATLVATVYLTTIAHAGRQAGEDPATGWALAASYGYVTILATLVIVGINAVWTAGTDDWIVSAIGYSFIVATAAAALLLLAAFVLGLPSTEPIDDDADDIDVADPQLDVPPPA